MDYREIEREKIARPKSSFQGYEQAVSNAIQAFTHDNQLLSAIEEGRLKIAHYHRLLLSIFHQVYFSSTSFGLAGAMLSQLSTPARSYLLHHAEEEKDHWIWILQDLRSTGYSGADPRSIPAHWTTQSYLSYGVYLSFFNPMGRLAMAQTLEGISGTFGAKYGEKAIRTLNLKKEQAQFFLMHGELDQGHTLDISSLLRQEDLQPEQWAEMENIASITSQLYKNIYNHAFHQETGR